MDARDYDRLRGTRDDGRDRPREVAQATAKSLAQRSLLLYLFLSFVFWIAISGWRGCKWTGHRAAFGLLSNPTGRLVLALSVLFLLLLSGFTGEGLLAGAGLWTLVLVAVAALYGARAWTARRRWEESCRETIKETVPGHNERYPPDLSFSRHRFLPVQDGRWIPHYDFSFRVPSALKPANISEVEGDIASALRAARDTTYFLDWRNRQQTGRCYAQAVPDLPDRLDYTTLWEKMDEIPGGDKVGPWRVPIGVSTSGIVRWDPEKIPHLLVGGPTGQGKSVAERAVIAHALRFPGAWRIFALDPKKVELSPLAPYGNVEAVCTEMSEMADVLDLAAEEMQARYDEMKVARGHCPHIHDLDPSRPLYLVVVDELAELTMSSSGKSEEAKAQAEYAERMSMAIELIAQKGRAAGIHLLMATQQPGISDGTMSSKTRMNTSGRVACGVMQSSSSRMLLKESDAAADPRQGEVKGRAIYLADSEMSRLQTVFTEWKHIDAQMQEMGYAPLEELA